MIEKPAAASPHQIKRQSLPESLAKSLRDRILNGEFKEGEPLIQDAIALEYGVSRIPVREALRHLEAVGLVAIEVHKGAFVTSIPTEQISELFELRALLECELLARAIPKMTSEHLASAQAIMTSLENSYRDGDIAGWGRLNWEFHRSLYVAADRVQTLEILQGINLQISRYICLQLLLTEAFRDARKEHRELLRLCKDRAVVPAVSHLHKHIVSAGCNLRASLEKSRAAQAA